MTTPEDEKLSIHDIQRHDFEAAKHSLQKYTEMNQQSVELAKVDAKDGLFRFCNHKVTGTELNTLIAQIQNHLVKSNTFHQNLVDELGQVYKALDALDNEYITAIVDSIKATEEVNRKTVNNQRDIQETISNQEKTIQILSKHSKEIKDNQSGLENAVTVLADFNEKLSKLEHIMDVDRAWELLDNQKMIVQTLEQYKDELSEIIHLWDVDGIWNDCESAKTHLENIDASIRYITQVQKECENRIQTLSAFQQKLSAVTHLGDADNVWSDTEKLKKAVEALKETFPEISKTVDSQGELMNGLTEAVNGIRISQQEMFASMNRTLDKHRIDIEEKVELLNSSQRKEFDLMTQSLAEDKQGINNRIVFFENSQQENMNQLVRSLAAERSTLNEYLETVNKKLIVAYVVAGGTTILTVIHLILNVVGIL